ncbi:MAG: hypothetical protein G5Z42_07235 [Caldisphaeraceae archaeon]|nr:hypothetical protein [Caldisphaeraceae archaeon]MEB3798589.1 hypothetical protein [Caldisphaeraceae archaeon]
MTAFVTETPFISFTTPSVINEIKDNLSKRILEMSLAAKKVSVLEVDNNYRQEVVKIAKNMGLNKKLSAVDVEVLALSYCLKKESGEVYIATDDYAMQKVAVTLGVKVIKIKYPGIRELKS